MTDATDTRSLTEVTRFEDPTWYAPQPFETYARLRREAPVFWYEPAQMWVLSTYENIKAVQRNPTVFSSGYGLVPADSIPHDDGSEIEDTGMPRRAELRRKALLGHFGPGSEALLMSDPPRHTALRKVINHAFTPRTVARLEDRVTQLAKETVSAIEPGSVGDLVELVSRPVPVAVMGELVGVPNEQLPKFMSCMDALVKTIDSLGKEEQTEEMQEYMVQLFEMATFFTEELLDRKANPRDDLLTALAESELDGEELSLENQLTMVTHLLLGGNETTRNLISGGARLLAEHPDQRKLVVDDLSLLPNLVEESLRLVAPAAVQCRTAREDIEVGGQPIKRGDYLELLFISANRDESVWDRSEEFDVTRNPDPMHLAFGFGEHYCVGAALARLQAKKVFEELLVTFPHFELAGEVEFMPSTLANVTESMPVRFL